MTQAAHRAYSLRMTESEPRIVAETGAYLAVFKPRGLHSAPLAEGESGTLLAWCGARRPETLVPRGRKAVERGLLHRLDRDTEGLVLFAKTQEAFDALDASQERGLFVKEYAALCVGRAEPALAGRSLPFVVESGFRPFGPGRRAVKPVPLDAAGRPLPEAGRVKELALDRGGAYRTEVLSLRQESENPPRTLAVCRLARGFRHQVRAHLAWIGLPLSGDGLYGSGGERALALAAVALTFPDPQTGAAVRIELPYGAVSSFPFSGRS